MVIGIILLLHIFLSLFSYLNKGGSSDSTYSRQHITGFQYWAVSHFVPALVEKGVFPLTVVTPKTHQLNQSIILDELDRVEQEGSPDSLTFVDHIPHHVWINELGHTWRYGQFGRILYLLPFEIISNSPYANIRFSNFLFFLISGSFFLFFSFRTLGPVFAGLVLGLLHLNPYYQFEIFSNENAFGVGFMLLLFILAMSFAIKEERFWQAWYFYPMFIIGVFLGLLVINIRAEFLPVLLIPLFFGIILKKGKAVLAGLALFGSIIMLNQTFIQFFENKLAESNSYLEQNGFEPYKGSKQANHPLFHSLICGLADTTDATWSDHYWYSKYIDKNPQRNLDLEGLLVKPMGVEQEVLYYSKLDEDPDYQRFAKESYLRYVKANSSSYLRHIFYRIWKNVVKIVPLVVLGVPIPFFVFVLIGIAGFFWLKHRGGTIKIDIPILLVLFSTLVVSFSNVLVYSNDQSQYGNVYHWFILAYFYSLIISGLWEQTKLNSK